MVDRARTADTEAAVSAGDIEQAERRIRHLVRETPMLSAGELSRRCGAPVCLKAENLQHTGSFKLRGASSKIASLTKAQLAAGVVTASAGNHGQAVALAAGRVGAHAQVFMPAEAPLAKVAAVRGYGGDVQLVAGTYDDAHEAARAAAERDGRPLIPPFDDPDVIAGQGTVALEIARRLPGARLVVVPVGGGGLASGVAIAIKAKLPDARVVGVQAEGRAGATICDGIAIKRPGRITLPLIERYVDELVTVNDDQAAEAMVLLLERSKLVVEGAGAVGVAALMHAKVASPPQGEVCVVLSGGNVDASLLAESIRLGETAAGRRLVLFTVVPDRPGALARLLRIVAEHGANVVDVVHLREGMDLHIRETGVQLVLGTQGPDHNAKIVAAVESEGFATRVER
jgi:threonine dehydratase